MDLGVRNGEVSKMRDILFKGKRKDNGEWVEGYIIIDGVTGQHFIHCIGNCLYESDKVNEEGLLHFVAFEVEPETVCQYTGITGRDNKKIFDKDIVMISEEGYKEDPDYLGLFPQSYGHFKKYTVEFLVGLYQTTYICKRDNEIMHLCKDLVYSRYLSAVGNVFDNNLVN